MKFTRAVEYAFRALRFLSKQDQNRWFAIQEIADAEDIPHQFLAKVMQRLNRKKLVVSFCGKKGGYKMARPPKEIKLGEILRAVEGPPSLNVCIIKPDKCRFHTACLMRGIWIEMQKAMFSILDKYSLADVVDISGDLSDQSNQ